MRVRELRDRLRLALEPLPDLGRRREMRRQHLDRDRPLEPRVARLVDLAHPARADRREDLVGAEAVPAGGSFPVPPASAHPPSRRERESIRAYSQCRCSKRNIGLRSLDPRASGKLKCL